MSDYNCIDVIREAQATVVAAAQSSTSFIPPLGKEKARVFTLNLRNRLIFKAADEEGALESADFLGKKRVIKKSWVTLPATYPAITLSMKSPRLRRIRYVICPSTPLSLFIANVVTAANSYLQSNRAEEFAVGIAKGIRIVTRTI